MSSLLLDTTAGPDVDCHTDLEGFAHVAARRRSVRRYLSIRPSRALVEQLLHLGCCAPSAHNRQPWRFVILRADESKARLAQAMGDKLRRDRLADKDARADIDADVARSYARITAAPVIILLCLTMEDMDRYREPTRNDHEFNMAVQSVAMAGQNIMLAADAAGLASCWMCAPMFCPDIVRQTLGLAQHWIPQGMLTLGYAANSGKPYNRKPAHETIFYLDEEDAHMP